MFGSVGRNQIGNAVPVNLGYHIGLAIRKMPGRSLAGAEQQPDFMKIENPQSQLDYA